MTEVDGSELADFPLKAERLTIRALGPDDVDGVAAATGPGTWARQSSEKRTQVEAERWLRNRMEEQEAPGYGIWGVDCEG